MKIFYEPFFYENLPACGAPGSVLSILALFSTPNLTGSDSYRDKTRWSGKIDKLNP